MKRVRQNPRRPIAVAIFPCAFSSFFLSALPSLLLPAFLSTGAIAETYHVPGDYPSIGSAIGVAAWGDTVLVGPGTYRERNHDTELGSAKYILKNGITLLSEGGPSATVLDGEREGTVLYANDVGAATIIEGFTIARGESSGDYPDIFGGGILCSASSPAFRDCVITGNVADHGGGLYCINGSAPSFLNCTFMSNEALYRGGGIFISSSEPTFENCIITGNRGESGGGIYTTYDASVFLGCTISGNEATYRGGGFYCFLTSTPVELERVILRGNCAAVGGQDAQLKWSGFSLTCNALRWDGIEGTNHQLIVNSLQVVEDPLFCEPEPCDEAPTPLGNYTLAGSSPCLPESSPCGRLIGALGAGCTIPSPTLSISWGRLKLGR